MNRILRILLSVLYHGLRIVDRSPSDLNLCVLRPANISTPSNVVVNVNHDCDYLLLLTWFAAIAAILLCFECAVLHSVHSVLKLPFVAFLHCDLDLHTRLTSYLTIVSALCFFIPICDAFVWLFIFLLTFLVLHGGLDHSWAQESLFHGRLCIIWLVHDYFTIAWTGSTGMHWHLLWELQSFNSAASPAVICDGSAWQWSECVFCLFGTFNVWWTTWYLQHSQVRQAVSKVSMDVTWEFYLE